MEELAKVLLGMMIINVVANLIFAISVLLMLTKNSRNDIDIPVLDNVYLRVSLVVVMSGAIAELFFPQVPTLGELITNIGLCVLSVWVHIFQRNNKGRGIPLSKNQFLKS